LPHRPHLSCERRDASASGDRSPRHESFP